MTAPQHISPPSTQRRFRLGCAVSEQSPCLVYQDRATPDGQRHKQVAFVVPESRPAGHSHVRDRRSAEYQSVRETTRTMVWATARCQWLRDVEREVRGQK